MFIGGGEHHVLSPYTDYVEEDRQVLVLDPGKMEEALAERPELIDEYVAGIRANMDNTRSNFSLTTFIRNRLEMAPADLASAPLPIRGGTLGKNQIRRHIADAGRPFIPGSTLKGAFRTAVYFAWLTRDEEGKAHLKELGERTEQLWKERGSDVEKIDSLYQEGKKYKARSLEKEIRDLLLEDKTFSETHLFGKLSDSSNPHFRGPDFRFFRVSDSSLLDAGTVEITEVDRIKLREVQKVSPQWCETIRPASMATFHLSVEATFQSPFLQSLFGDGIEPLIEVVHRFAEASIDYELETLKRHDEPELQGVSRFYRNELKSREKSPNTCLMRIGFGKTYYDNSIGLALYHHDKEVFRHFRKLLGLGRNPVSKKLVEGRFPTTRSFAAHDARPDAPLGWVELVFHEGKVAVAKKSTTKATPEPDPEAVARVEARYEEAARYPEVIREWVRTALEPRGREVLLKKAEEWLDILESMEPLHRKSIEFFANWLDERFKGIMANPDKTKGKKQKPAYKPRQIAIAKRLIALLEKTS